MIPYRTLGMAAQGTRDGPSKEDHSSLNVPLWLIVEISAQDFSSKIDYNEELDLLLAPKGNFIGFATSSDELDSITTSKSREVKVCISGSEGGVQTEVRADYVYLTYKAGFKGTKDLQKLLEFLLKEGMLKPQST
ncbi:hypothetical protein LCGC14_2733580 [marine sediment metagenome]|uniref:Uncharacterized protein n=1 Tax=marine sediment metagenome TaxID=412755 RepID=A0A0F8Z6M6_9ZZZZ